MDISQSAVDKARNHLKSRNVKVRFIQDTILNSKLGHQFDYILDRGCFHGMQLEQRGFYVRELSKLLKPNGYLFLKCFSHLETMKEVPYRFSPEDIKKYFNKGFKVSEIEDAVF